MEIKKLAFYFVNAYLIRGEKTVLFDTGAVVSPEDLPGYLAQYDVDPAEVDLIVISHAHWDHVQLAKAWKEYSGAQLLCHRSAIPVLAEGKERHPRYDYGHKAQEFPPFIEFMEADDPSTKFETVTPDIVMEGEEFDLHPFGCPGKLIHTPGHDDSAIALILDDGSAFIGDTVIDLHTVDPLADMYPAGTYGLNWICTGEKVLANSVRRLLDEASVFYTGHGEPFSHEVLAEALANAS